MITLGKFKDAAEVLKDTVRRTDLILAEKLMENGNLYLKVENLQVTGSFKVRGASYKIANLPEDEKAKGVIACSAGNHAQGVALASQKNNIKATIFIPATAPISKVEATRKYGAEIKLIDGVYDDAYNAAVEYQKQTGATFVHPFNDEDVIAGQGTIGLEILEELPDVEAVVVPIGGGGLIAGVAAAIKQLKPDCKVYGVQAIGASSMQQSYKQNHVIELPTVHTFADGTAVKRPGDLTFDLCSKYVDDIVTVHDDEIACAILSLMEQEKLVTEGAGALSVAAVLFDKLPIKGKKTVCILSGGNIDVNILSRVINRGLLKSGRMSHLTIELLDKPGQLREVSSIIAEYGANVIRVRHTQGGEGTDINDCYLKISMETKDSEHFELIQKELTRRGYKITSNTQ